MEEIELYGVLVVLWMFVGLLGHAGLNFLYYDSIWVPKVVKKPKTNPWLSLIGGPFTALLALLGGSFRFLERLS